MKILIAAAALFIAAPAAAETLPQISWKVEKSGPASNDHPTRKSAVEVRYRGTLMNGKVFDETPAGKTSIFPLKVLIPGWVAVVQQMKRGDIWTVTLPPQFAYGAKGTGDVIPPNATLLFRIELIDFADMPPAPMEPMTKLPGK